MSTINEVTLQQAIVALGSHERSLREKALEQGCRDETCPRCGTLFLAHKHFIKCEEADCPMIDPTLPTALDVIFGTKSK